MDLDDVPTTATQPPRAARLSRRTLILGGTAAAAAVASASVLTARLLDDSPRRPTLRWRGVNVDTDRSMWRPGFVRNEMRTIARDLHG